MSKSILQPGLKECFLCRRDAEEVGYYGLLSAAGLHCHHIMFGTANRKISDEFGVWCWLCPGHHEFGEEAVHRNRETDLYLKKAAQRRFEELYSHEKWMELFNSNYLDAEEISNIAKKSQESWRKSQEIAKKSQNIETKGFWLLEGMNKCA